MVLVEPSMLGARISSESWNRHGQATGPAPGIASKLDGTKGVLSKMIAY